MQKGGNKAVFLDRDGTINREKQYLCRISDFEYLEGAVEGMRALSHMGFLLVVITNQSGIARGYYTEQDYRRLDAWMKGDLLERGVKIAASYYCPHLPGGCVAEYAKECGCRKPKTGLFWKAADELGIDMGSSFAVGDRPRDLSICSESGVRGILLSSGAAHSERYEICSDWDGIIRKIRIFGEQE